MAINSDVAEMEILEVYLETSPKLKHLKLEIYWYQLYIHVVCLLQCTSIAGKKGTNCSRVKILMKGTNYLLPYMLVNVELQKIR